MDVVTLALCKGYTNLVALGIGDMRVEGTDVIFTIAKTGEEVKVTLPIPKDGVSVENVEVKENNHLICTMSDGTIIDAGEIKTQGGEGGKAISIKVNDIEIPSENNTINLQIPTYDYRTIKQLGTFSITKKEDNTLAISDEFWEICDNFDEYFPEYETSQFLGDLVFTNVTLRSEEGEYKFINNINIDKLDSGRTEENDVFYFICRNKIFYIMNMAMQLEITPEGVEGSLDSEIELDIEAIFGKIKKLDKEFLPDDLGILDNSLFVENNEGSNWGSLSIFGRGAPYGERNICFGNNDIEPRTAHCFAHGDFTHILVDAIGCHSEGYATYAGNSYSHAEGHRTKAFKRGSHAEGDNTTANGDFSHAEGKSTIASGENSHTTGESTSASAKNSSANGFTTKATNYGSFSIGKFNVAMTTGGTQTNQTGTVFAVGNGPNASRLSNAFTVDYANGVATANTIQTAENADYAENFEWADGNPDGEDRVGLFVTLTGNKIRIANDMDDYILGVVSGAPFVLGNGDCGTWNGMYLRDEFNRIITEPAPKLIEELDEETGEITYKESETEFEGTRLALNPDFDSNKTYVSRADRKEWAPVGMLGVLSVYQDGSLEVDGYADVNMDGKATHALYGYRVIEIVNDKIAKIIFR